MKTVVAHLVSASPYSQSRPYEVPKLERELPMAYEERTWRERMHVDSDAHVVIPSTQFKNSIAEAAKYMGEQIPGKGKQNYTKHFEAGVMVTDDLVLPLKRDEVLAERLFVPASGKRGDGKRVWKIFPLIPQWSGQAVFHVLDEIITEDVFLRTLEASGRFIGIGRYRPRNNGRYGRFSVESLQWDV
jgi:hypothetical protein